MNHPLNNVGYQRLRELVCTTLIKVNAYLDLKIIAEKRAAEKERVADYNSLKQLCNK